MGRSTNDHVSVGRTHKNTAFPDCFHPRVLDPFSSYLLTIEKPIDGFPPRLASRSSRFARGTRSDSYLTTEISSGPAFESVFAQRPIVGPNHSARDSFEDGPYEGPVRRHGREELADDFSAVSAHLWGSERNTHRASTRAPVYRTPASIG